MSIVGGWGRLCMDMQRRVPVFLAFSSNAENSTFVFIIYWFYGSVKVSLQALQWINDGCTAAKLMTMFDNYRQAFDGGISYDIAGRAQIGRNCLSLQRCY